MKPGIRYELGHLRSPSPSPRLFSQAATHILPTHYIVQRTSGVLGQFSVTWFCRKSSTSTYVGFCTKAALTIRCDEEIAVKEALGDQAKKERTQETEVLLKLDHDNIAAYCWVRLLINDQLYLKKACYPSAQLHHPRKPGLFAI